MPIKRKYNFRPGTTIASTHMNEELDQLIAAANNIEAADNKKDADLRKIAQLFKLTMNNGTIKRLPSNTDLNTVFDAGVHYAGTTSLINTPVQTIGTLEVLPYSATAVLQRYTVMSTTSPRVFVRYGSNNVWSKWIELVTDNIDPWLSISLRSGWSSYSSYTAGYYKNPLNEVKWRGYLTAGTRVSGTLLFTMPEKYRPGNDIRIPTVVSKGGVAESTMLTVSASTGEVRLVYDVPASAFLALDVVPYRAER